KGEGGDAAVALEDGTLATVLVPEADGAVLAAGGEPLAVGAVSDADDGAVVAGQLGLDFLRVHVPDADRLPERRGRQALAAGMEGNAGRAAEKHGDLGLFVQVPNADSARVAARLEPIDAADGEQPAGGMKRQRLHGTVVKRIGDEQLRLAVAG